MMILVVSITGLAVVIGILFLMGSIESVRKELVKLNSWLCKIHTDTAFIDCSLRSISNTLDKDDGWGRK